jgi:hypothetical protein
MAPAPGADLLDAAAPAERPRSAWSGWWPIAAAVAAALVLWGLTAAPSDDSEDDVALALVGHTGSALDGQRFLRFYFSLSASGGDAEIEQVEMLLGGTREDGVAPRVIGEGSATKVLVDVVPDCPRAAVELPVGTLEVTYDGGSGTQVATLPLPISGSLPRLVIGRCAELDRL